MDSINLLDLCEINPKENILGPSLDMVLKRSGGVKRIHAVDPNFLMKAFIVFVVFFLEVVYEMFFIMKTELKDQDL